MCVSLCLPACLSLCLSVSVSVSVSVAVSRDNATEVSLLSVLLVAHKRLTNSKGSLFELGYDGVGFKEKLEPVQRR